MTAVLRIRRAAVAGAFYPADAHELMTQVDALLAGARASASSHRPAPKALIVPHAGYVYSGPVAATAYARIAVLKGRIRRVVLVGPAHRVWFEGVAEAGADGFETPLGTMRTPRADAPNVISSARAHAGEHSLEVQLPFLQRTLGDVDVIPLLAGDASTESVAGVLEALWGGPDTLILISSDLSHYHSWDQARRIDGESAAQIDALGPPLTHDQACGATPVNGLLLVARRKGLQVDRLDLRNSGDTAGPRDQVVGYGAFAFYEHDAG